MPDPEPRGQEGPPASRAPLMSQAQYQPSPEPVEPEWQAVPAGAHAPAVRLPVRSPEEVGRAQAPAPAYRDEPEALEEAQTYEIPVRTASEPGYRTQPQHVNGQGASLRLVPTAEGEVWFQTVQELVAAEAITALVRELALQSQLIARDQDHWLLRVERESLNQPTARERLRAALEAAGHTRQISVEVGKVLDSPARRNAYAAAQRQRLAEDIVQSDPRVQQLIRDFGAKIVPGSIRPA